MPRIRPSTLVLPALAALILATGCTTTVTGSPGAAGAAPAPSAPTGDAAAWVDEVCGALLPFIEVASAPPQLDAATDRAGLVRTLSTFFGEAGDAADAAISDIDAAGPSPVPGGDAVVAALRETLTARRTSFEEVKARIDAVDPGDGQALMAELPAAVGPLQDIRNMPDPTAAVQRIPELADAAAQAPNCRRIESGAGR